MNDDQAPRTAYHPRWAAGILRERLRDFPAVVVTGPRQVGKSTLLRHELAGEGYTFLDLDESEQRRRLAADPALAWAGRDRVVIDEVHRVPEILPSLKAEVDRRAALRVVLSGSANLLLMKGVSESLAGRAAYMELLPPAVGEWEDRGAPFLLGSLLRGELPPEAPATPRSPWPDVARGMLPPARLREEPIPWWDAYVRTYLERDLRDLSAISSLPDFRRLMALLALHTGQMLNETELASRLSVSQPTVHRYLGLLEISHLFAPLPGFADNRGKRIIRRPRAYLADPGLASFLAGLYTPDEVAASREAGPLFESLVFHHLRVLASLLTPPAQLYFWRTTDGKEVDFVLVHGRRILAFECKASTRPVSSDAAHLRLFRSLYPECAAAVVVHAGDRVAHLGNDVVALPWTMLAGL
ncbi:ATP-binding protein [Myxococcota bacterium]|nr:ATP-binding protein [Myxococcota bacterium]